VVNSDVDCFFEVDWLAVADLDARGWLEFPDEVGDLIQISHGCDLADDGAEAADIGVDVAALLQRMQLIAQDLLVVRWLKGGGDVVDKCLKILKGIVDSIGTGGLVVKPVESGVSKGSGHVVDASVVGDVLCVKDLTALEDPS